MTGLENYREADILTDIRLDFVSAFFSNIAFEVRYKNGCCCVHLAAEVDKGDKLLGICLPPVDHEHHVGGENKGDTVSTMSNEKTKIINFSIPGKNSCQFPHIQSVEQGSVVDPFIESRSGFRGLMTKNWKKYYRKINFLF
jgi:hypothetical protein